jgi:hypothetical protein
MDYTPEELAFLTLIGQVTTPVAASAAPVSQPAPKADPAPTPTDTTKAEA